MNLVIGSTTHNDFNAYAASSGSKIQEEIRIQKSISTSHFDTPVMLCGESDNYDLKIILRNYHFVLYDDGSYRITATTYVQFFGSTGESVAASPQTQLISNGSNQFNVIINCYRSGGTSEGQEHQDLNYHLGFMIDKNGQIGEIHLVHI